LDEQTADRVIEEQIAFFEAQEQGFEWKVFDYDTPPDLGERLAARGFTAREVDAVMVLPLRDAPDLLREPVIHQVDRVTSPSMVEEVVALESEVWNEEFDWLQRQLTFTLERHPNQISIFVARVDGRPVSAGWIMYPLSSRFAGLWGGSTLEGYRGRGLYRAVLATRLQEALSRGVQFLTVDASPMSKPILERHGFIQIAEAFAYSFRVRSQAA
jgi:hypothetical protein